MKISKNCKKNKLYCIQLIVRYSWNLMWDLLLTRKQIHIKYFSDIIHLFVLQNPLNEHKMGRLWLYLFSLIRNLGKLL